jgi:hypothetical protein
MPSVSANGIEIFYDEVGDPKEPAILLKSRAIGWSDAHLRTATPARYYMRLLFNFAGQRVPTPAASPRPNHPTADSSMFRPVE